MINSVALAAGLVCAAAPTVFAPGIVSSAAHDSAPAFSADGDTVYFSRSSREASIIMVSQHSNERWTPAQIAPFSGRWSDMEPALAPDGSYLVFASNRPASEGGAPLDGKFGGSLQKGRGGNLWIVKRTVSGWGKPERLPDVINASRSTFAPSMAQNGDLYFMRADGPKSRFRLFRAKASGRDGYEVPEPLPFSDGSATDVDPAVAPDQSFIVFGSSRHADKDIDLFVAFRGADGWTIPTYLGDSINSPLSDAEPRLGRDGHTLYYSSERMAPVAMPIDQGLADTVLHEMEQWNNGLYNIWTVDLGVFLASRQC